MTPAQKRVLDQYRTTMAATGGVAPSYREVATALGLTAISGINRAVNRLETLGYLRRQRGRARSIRLVEADLAATSDAALITECRRRGLIGRAGDAR